jgi:GT2 family glycosyltransferase
LGALERQTFPDFEVVVVDNSGSRRVQSSSRFVRVISNQANAGFGAAINQAAQSSQSKYVAALNDDAVPSATWLEALIDAAEANPRSGMFASQVRLTRTTLDSTGMLIAADGSSKQRGHGRPTHEFAHDAEALFPSGSAALYRRGMVDQIGLFDDSFFLYCEDTDLGLRARWAGWGCSYVPEAIVEHKYSHSAGTASLTKAYYVERNRLYTIVKNFPLPLLAAAPFAALVRYFWHAVSVFEGRGKAAEFHKGGRSAAWLPLVVLCAHAAMLLRLPRLLWQRRLIMKARRISSRDFRQLLKRHSISLRKVASL